MNCCYIYDLSLIIMFWTVSVIKCFSFKMKFCEGQNCCVYINIYLYTHTHTHTYIHWYIYMYSNTYRMCMQSHFSCDWLSATLRTVAHQAPLSMGFSRQEHWCGLPCPPAGDLSYPENEPSSPALIGKFFTTSVTICMFVCVCMY